MKSLFILLISLSLSVYTFAQKTSNPIPLSTGMGLKYSIQDGADFEMDVIIKEYSPTAISFNWLIERFPRAIIGKVSMTSDALENASKFEVSFERGDDLAMKNKTSLWMSQKLFAALKKGKETSMNLGEGEKVYTGTKGSFDFNGKSLDALVISSADTKEKIYVLYSDENPLLLKVEMGFTMELKQTFSADQLEKEEKEVSQGLEELGEKVVKAVQSKDFSILKPYLPDSDYITYMGMVQGTVPISKEPQSVITVRRQKLLDNHLKSYNFLIEENFNQLVEKVAESKAASGAYSGTTYTYLTGEKVVPGRMMKSYNAQAAIKSGEKVVETNFQVDRLDGKWVISGFLL